MPNTIENVPFFFLLPDRWAAIHPEHAHHDRIEEKRQAAENKLFCRLQTGLAGILPYAAAPSLIVPTE